MRFIHPNARNRDTRIQVRQPQITYNDDGKEVRGTDVTFSFWGRVTDMMDQQRDNLTYVGGQRLDARTVKIEADSRSVANVNIKDTLVLDNSTDVFEVMDKYDSEFRYTATIIAKYKSNG